MRQRSRAVLPGRDVRRPPQEASSALGAVTTTTWGSQDHNSNSAGRQIPVIVRAATGRSQARTSSITPGQHPRRRASPTVPGRPQRLGEEQTASWPSRQRPLRDAARPNAAIRPQEAVTAAPAVTGTQVLLRGPAPGLAYSPSHRSAPLPPFGVRLEDTCPTGSVFTA